MSMLVYLQVRVRVRVRVYMWMYVCMSPTRYLFLNSGASAALKARSTFALSGLRTSPTPECASRWRMISRRSSES